MAQYYDHTGDGIHDGTPDTCPDCVLVTPEEDERRRQLRRARARSFGLAGMRKDGTMVFHELPIDEARARYRAMNGWRSGLKWMLTAYDEEFRPIYSEELS